MGNNMPVTSDQVRVSVVRLMEAAVIGGIIMYGGFQVMGSKVEGLEENLREHRDQHGHRQMEVRMSAQESHNRWRENQITEIKEQMNRIEDKVDALQR